MIDRKYSRIVLALVLVMLAASVATVVWGPVHGLVAQLRTLTTAMGALLSWAFIWLWLTLIVGKPEKLEDTMRRFVGRILVAVTVLVFAGNIFWLTTMWKGAPPISIIAYVRLVFVSSGLIFIFFGNIVPKLSYQQTRQWIEVGPARHHRLNRIGGWLMVVAGIATVVAALALPADPRSLVGVYLAIAAAMLVPYLALAAIYVRAYRHELQAEHSA
jgi:drug/metabolite transporter (DMT)-like permease